MTSEIKRIAETATSYFGLPVDALASTDKHLAYINARHSFWIILRDDMEMTLKDIGELTGHKHSVVSNGTRNDRRRQLDHELKAIREQLGISRRGTTVSELLRKLAGAIVVRPSLFEEVERLLSS